MNRSSVWLVSALCLSAGTVNRAQDAAPRHVGQSDSDQFLVCARTLLRKPVFRDNWSFRNATGLSCPTSLDGLRRELATRGEYLYETNEWALLYPARFRERNGPLGPMIPWYRLALTFTTRNWGGIPDTREVTAVDLEAIRRAVLATARLAPIRAWSRETTGDTTSIEYQLRVAALRLGPGPPESVIGILGEVHETGRLISGEFGSNGFKVLWDSPLLSTAYLEFGFDDVDGDGVKEILLVSTYGKLFEGQILSVFNSEGRELTRQPDCFFNDMWGFDEPGGVCPVAADEIRFDDPRNGKKDLLVRGRQEDVGKPDFSKLHRYSLQGGRYVHIGVVREP